MALKLKLYRTENKGGSPSGSAATARTRGFDFALFRLPIWRMLERRGVAEPLVYSSTRHSAIFANSSLIYLLTLKENFAKILLIEC